MACNLQVSLGVPLVCRTERVHNQFHLALTSAPQIEKGAITAVCNAELGNAD
jgi:hypothetical protein